MKHAEGRVQGLQGGPEGGGVPEAVTRSARPGAGEVAGTDGAGRPVTWNAGVLVRVEDDAALLTDRKDAVRS